MKDDAVARRGASRLPAWLAPAAAALLGPLAPASAPAAPATAPHDKDAVARHVRKSFSLPRGMELELKDIKPSPIPGFDAALLESRFQGQTRAQPLLVSRDGRHYVLTQVFDLKESKLPGILVAGSEDPEGGPQIHVTKDLKHVFLGAPRDLTVDPDKANLAKIKLGKSPSRGPDSAAVVVVEYSDIQCPYCEKAHRAMEDNLDKTYGRKVRWVFKHFPLTNIHPWAYHAAIAASCAQAHKPAASWAVVSALFKAQKDIHPGNIKAKASEAARAAGVDAARFEACYDAQESKPLVEADIEEAKELGVNSTPTFVVNGRKTEGFRSFDDMKELIDEMLAEKGAK